MQGIARANFIFELQFNTYANPSHESHINGGCCDDGNRAPPNCRNRCDTYLHICLRQISTMNVSRQDDEECSFGSVLTDLLGDGSNGDEIALTAGGSLDVTGNLTNPLQFSNNKTWPVSVSEHQYYM